MKFTIKNSLFIKLIIIFFILMSGCLFLGCTKIIPDTMLFLYVFSLLLIVWIVLVIRRYELINVPVIFSAAFLLVLGCGPVVLEIVGFTYFKYQIYIYMAAFILFFGSYGLFMLLFRTKCKFKHTVYIKSYQCYQLFFLAVMIFCLGLLSTFVYIYINKAYLFSGNLNSGRIQALSGNGIFLYTGKLMWLAIYICYEEYLRNNKYKKILIVMLILAVSSSLLLGFRSTIIDAVLVLIVMKNKRYPINQERLIIIGFSMIALIMVYAVFREGNLMPSLVADKIFNELRVNSVNFNNIVKTFPNKIEFQYGYTYLINIIMLTPGSDPDFTTWLKDALDLHFEGGGVTPSIIGEFYINWGFWGIVIGMIILGFIFAYIQVAYEKSSSIFLPSLFLGYIRSFVTGGIANSMIIFAIMVIGYLISRWVAGHIHFIKRNYILTRRVCNEKNCSF